jgi:membrane fusion protein, multidrug efflux system
MLTSRIVPENQMWVQANFKETQLGSVRIGQPATVRSDFGQSKRGHV